MTRNSRRTRKSPTISIGSFFGGFASITSTNQLAELLHEAQTGQAQSVFASTNDGHDTTINLGNHDSVTLTNVQLASLHASNFMVG